MSEFGQRVIDYRLKNGVTQEEMAKMCGLSRQTICALEKNPYHQVNILTRHKLEKVLNKTKERDVE